jgi:DNA-3-methyladenine glycosylase I
VHRLLGDAGIIRNRLKVEAAIANAKTVLALRESHGSFAGWLDAHHFVEGAKTRGREDAKTPHTKAEWVALFKRTFRFTGGEIVGEFLQSTGYLPGAHRDSCPVYARIAKRRPAWMRAGGPSL